MAKFPYFVVWQQQDGTYRFRLNKKGPCHPRMTGTADTEEECIKLARQCVTGCFIAENAARIREGNPYLYHGKKKYEPKEAPPDDGLLPLFT